jgi:hypothetical protein
MENRYWVLGRFCGKVLMWPPMLRPGHLVADGWTDNSKWITSFTCCEVWVLDLQLSD